MKIYFCGSSQHCVLSCLCHALARYERSSRRIISPLSLSLSIQFNWIIWRRTRTIAMNWCSACVRICTVTLLKLHHAISLESRLCSLLSVAEPGQRTIMLARLIARWELCMSSDSGTIFNNSGIPCKTNVMLMLNFNNFAWKIDHIQYTRLKVEWFRHSSDCRVVHYQHYLSCYHSYLQSCPLFVESAAPTFNTPYHIVSQSLLYYQLQLYGSVVILSKIFGYHHKKRVLLLRLHQRRPVPQNDRLGRFIFIFICVNDGTGMWPTRC